MFGTRNIDLLWLVTGFAFAGLAFGQAHEGVGRAREPIVIRLEDTARVPDRLVLLDDVAELTGGAELLRKRFAKLDLAAAPAPGQKTRITKKQVLYRLLLAGYSRSLFLLEGPDSVTVELAKYTVTVEQMVQAAIEAVRSLLPSDLSDAAIRVLREPDRAVELAGALPEEVRIAPVLNTFLRPSGQMLVPIDVYLRGKLFTRQYVSLSVQVYESVPIAVRAINPGDEFTVENVAFRRVAVDGPMAVPGREQIIGQRARRLLRPLQAITLADIAEAEQESAPIKPRQIVELLVQRPGLKVTARGESLQSARVGDMIRVRNVDSNRVIVGWVIAPGVVEVRF